MVGGGLLGGPVYMCGQGCVGRVDVRGAAGGGPGNWPLTTDFGVLGTLAEATRHARQALALSLSLSLSLSLCAVC